MKKITMAGWAALSFAVFGVGCGGGESNSEKGSGDAGGSVPGTDAPPVEVGKPLDTGLPIDTNLPPDTKLAADVPLPIDTAMGVDLAPAIDSSITIDGSTALDSGIAIDLSAAVDAADAVPADAAPIDTAGCTVLPNRFDADTVLPKGCYLAQKTPIIAAGVRLTLAPGVTIVFSTDAGLSFSANQVLVAAGTAADPILLTGVQPQRGYWKGVSFDGTLTTDSVLDHVIIEYAGTTKSDRDAAGVKMTADSRGVRASITNTTVRESQGWGLWLGGSTLLGAFANNTLTKNTLGPASVSTQVVGVLDAVSTYRGNDRDQLVVTDSAIGKAATWAALDVPYFISTGVSPAADWTVSPGTTFVMASGSSIDISGDASALIANGTAGKPILFTGAQPTRGYWQGLIFDGSNNTRNTLAYVTVEAAGSTASDRDAADVKLIADSHGVQVNMSSCTFRQSQGWGLYLTGSAVVPQFVGNQLTQNLLGPAMVGSTAAHQLLPQSTYTGNDTNRVWVRSDHVAQAVTWSAIGVPYVIDGPIDAHLVWTLAPGVELLLDADAGITVAGDQAGFHAVGTAAAPITISGLTKTPGAWDSIVFDNTLNAGNIIDHCIVEFGGGGAAAGENGMIITQSDSHGVALSVTNSTIRNSAVYGLWMGSYSQIVQTGNTFSGNALGNTYQQP